MPGCSKFTRPDRIVSTPITTPAAFMAVMEPTRPGAAALTAGMRPSLGTYTNMVWYFWKYPAVTS